MAIPDPSSPPASGESPPKTAAGNAWRALLATLLLATLLLAACETTPTGRRQLQLLPAGQVAEMGEVAYAQMREKEPLVPAGQPVSQYIACVSRAVAAVVGPPKGGGNWDVSVFRGDAVNAFALPGGNIGVYTGLLKAATSPAQLAAVIGHEIAHVQAEHPNARLSTQFAADAGLSLVQVLAQGTPLESQQAMALLGLGTQVGLVLPFTRGQESEADILGLRYMAEAGFDPQAAVELWQNMARFGGGGPDFLSTHPSGESRIETLRANMAKALEVFRQAQARGRRPVCTPAAA